MRTNTCLVYLSDIVTLSLSVNYPSIINLYTFARFLFALHAAQHSVTNNCQMRYFGWKSILYSYNSHCYCSFWLSCVICHRRPLRIVNHVRLSHRYFRIPHEYRAVCQRSSPKSYTYIYLRWAILYCDSVSAAHCLSYRVSRQIEWQKCTVAPTLLSTHTPLHAV